MAHGPEDDERVAKARAGKMVSKGKASKAFDAYDEDLEDGDVLIVQPELGDEPVSMSIYQAMKFPQYQFREFPKWVRRPSDGKEQLCESQAHELQFLTALPSGEIPLTAAEKENAELAKMNGELQRKLAEAEKRLANVPVQGKEADPPKGGFNARSRTSS